MQNMEPYRKKQVINEMILAFLLYVEEGIKAVENLYPQHKKFVLDNKSKSVKDIKHELTHYSHA